MEYRRLGTAGLKVSALSLGSWVTFGRQVQTNLALELMAMAYDHGVNFFDNAEVYENGQSEIVMGEALAQLNWSRDSYIVSSKVFWGGDKPTQRGLSRKHIHDACHAALKRLQVDYLDLFFCHRPDIETPIAETVFAMNGLIQQGKILYWGTSEWSASQIMAASACARENNLIGPTMEQPQYNMFVRDKVEAEFEPVYQEIGLGTTIWSPLASGFLTGKYNQAIPADSRANLASYEWLKALIHSEKGQDRISKVKVLMEIASGLNMSLPQLAVAWCLANPRVSTVILGASKVPQLAETITAVEHLDKVTPEILADIEAVLQNKPKLPEKY